jgi:hypothetical protein
VPARLPALLADPPAGRERLWLTGGRLFDGTGTPVRDRAAVLVQDGQIAAVADVGDGTPDGVTVIELEGRILMPGLIDAHAHVKVERPEPDPGAEPLLPAAGQVLVPTLSCFYGVAGLESEVGAAPVAAPAEDDADRSRHSAPAPDRGDRSRHPASTWSRGWSSWPITTSSRPIAP